MVSGVPIRDIAGAQVADEMILHWTFSLRLEAAPCGLLQCHRFHLHVWLAGVARQARRILLVLVILPAVGIVCEILIASWSA